MGSRTIRVAVLGAGIMGSSVALFLARKGARVTLIDAAPGAFSKASRWNEGKIHLGYLYSGDPTLETARLLLPGALSFKPLTEELVGCSLAPATAADDEVYLVHRDSVVTPEAMARYFEAVTGLVRAAPNAGDYLVDASTCATEPLSPRELESLADTHAIVAGFRVPERSVWTSWLADRYLGAIEAEPRIELLSLTRVTAVRPAETTVDGRWRVEATSGVSGDFDFVVNALWESKLAIDATAGLQAEAGWSHRYRLALFVHTDKPVDVRSAVIALGPFGDVKNYTGRDFYLSWYPAGLVAEGEDLSPPSLPLLDDSVRQLIAISIMEHLGSLMPQAKALAATASATTVHGGWVFAMGQGSLADPSATLHRRSQFGVSRLGSYISVDTGKYSVAPWLARKLVGMILPT